MSSPQAILSCEGRPANQVERSITTILERTTLCSIATTCEAGQPYINTCFFAHDAELQLYILTPPKTTHAQNIARTGKVAMTVFDSHQISGAELQGLQIFGTCKQATTDEQLQIAFEVYAKRFSTLKTAAKNVQEMLRVFESRLFIISPESIKIFDEQTFGKETWVLAKVKPN